MYRIILLLFILLCFTPLCYTEEIPVDTLIRGVNQARLTIQSGEVQTQTTIKYAARKTEVEIAAWIQMEKEQELKYISNDVDLKQYENEYLLPDLNERANRFRKHTKQEHTTTLFQVLEQNNVSRPRLFQYKLTNVDTPGYPLDKMSDRFTPSDSLVSLVYDMQIQVREALGNIRFSGSLSTINNSNFYSGYAYFSVWGKSHFYVPSDAKLLGKETIDNVECYGLSFIAPDKRKVHIWIDPTKDFCLRRIDYYHPTIETKMPYTRITYKNFKKYQEVWFPHILEDTVYFANGKIASRATTEAIAVELNVDFPKDFFKINKEYYKLSDTEDNTEQGKSSTPTNTESDTILLLCGPQSLFHICELLKVDTNLNELKKLTNFSPDRGTTMLGLKKAANYKGLAPAGVKASVELLKRKKVPLPAIAYVENNHFFVFESVNSYGVNIMDSVKKYGPHITWDELSNIWEGDLLIFIKKKMHRKKQSNSPLAFSEKPIYDFGKALGGSKIEHTFTIKNIGKKPLEILSVTETCVCTASVLSQDEILPGKTGSISSVLIVPTGNGKLYESLHVLTNDPIQNTLTLTIKGEAFTPLKTFPELIVFGKQKPLKNPVTKRISLHIQEGTKIQSVRTDSKYINATLKMKDNIPYAEVQFLSNLPAGKFSHNILVDYIFEGEQATHNVAIFGEIIGELRVVPNRLFFGLIKDTSSFSKTITISSRDMQPFEITSTESSTKLVNVTVTNNQNEKRYQLTTTIAPEAKSGEVTGEIVIHTSNSVQPKIHVPFFGIISGSN